MPLTLSVPGWINPDQVDRACQAGLRGQERVLGGGRQVRCVENCVYWVCFCVSHSNKEYSVMLSSSQLQPEGSSWALKIPVVDIIVHPKYWGRNFIRSDIALLLLETPVTFNKYVQPICLPEQGFNLEVGTQCWVTGWDKTKQHSSDNLTLTPELREAEVFILDNKKCDHIFRKTSFYPGVTALIRRNMLCATNYGENVCYGDSGGPLACEIDGRWILAGVLSWEKACIKPRNPGVYTRLTKYTRWIKEQVNHAALPGPCQAFCLLSLFWLLQLPAS
ncbi:Inactive serine protease 45 [Lemmus lemmus]